MQSSKFKVVFLGTPDFVQPIKENLAKYFTLVDSLNEADLAVVAAFGHILTKKELETPKHGCINVHPSLLPKYRGPSPIQSAILSGDKISGITIIKMDEEADHGPILYQEQIELSNKDNFDTLSKRMFLKSAKVLPQITTKFVSGKITPLIQDHSQATYTKHFTKQDGYFDISNPPSPDILDRMIRAYYPWPGVWTIWRGESGKGKGGRIVKFLPGNELQMEGKKAISFKDFLNGYPDFPLKSITLDKE